MPAAALAVSQGEFVFEDWMITFNLPNTITEADVGKAVSLDNTADMKVKLCGDGDTILGRLEQVEIRAQEGLYVGTVALKFIGALPSSGAIGRGVPVVGSATAGSVKAGTAAVITSGTVPAQNNVTLSAAANNVVNVAFGL